VTGLFRVGRFTPFEERACSRIETRLHAPSTLVGQTGLDTALRAYSTGGRGHSTVGAPSRPGRAYFFVTLTETELLVVVPIALPNSTR
jgi:hypothetical protein